MLFSIKYFELRYIFETSLVNANLNILAYDFKKLANTTCSTRSDLFETLNEAKQDCEDRKECKGVIDVDCNGHYTYSICLENTTVISDSKSESCFYEKYIIGKNRVPDDD